MKKYHGFIAAGFTPMKENEEVDYDKIPAIVAKAKRNGMSALFINGTTAEFATLTTQERLKLAELYLKTAKGKLPIIVHVGSSSVMESALLAKHAEDHGADAVAALAPFYFRPNGVIQLTKTLKQIAGACPSLPFYYYHMPSMTGVNLPVHELLPQIEKEIPNFAGVKFTSEDLMDFQLSLDYAPNKFQIMFGRDEILLAGLSLGTEAMVGGTYNYVSRISHEVKAAFEKNDIQSARIWQRKNQLVVKFLHKYGFAAHKILMKFSGLDVGPTRTPISALSQTQEANIKDELKRLELLEYFD